MDPVSITVTCVSSIISAVVGGGIVLIAIQRPLKKFDSMSKKIEEFDESRIKKLEEGQKSCSSCSTAQEVKQLDFRLTEQAKSITHLTANRDAVIKVVTLIERMEGQNQNFELKLDSVAELSQKLVAEIDNQKQYISNVSRKLTRHTENHK